MNIKKLYNELITTTLILNFFDSVLTGMSAFALSYIIIYFYRLKYYFAIGIASFFFIRSFYKKIKQNKILLLEEKYPDLKERLRTSFDYKLRSNSVIDSLHSDIVRMMKKVDVNAYLSSKKLAIKVFVICLSLSSVIYLSSVGIDSLDIKVRIESSDFYRKAETIVSDIFEKRDEVSDRPWLQDPRLLSLGTKETNVSIDTYNTEIDITDISEGEKNDFGGHYPEEIKGSAKEVYEEGIPEEHKEVIKEYFKKINE